MSENDLLNKKFTEIAMTRRSFLKWSATLAGGTAALAAGGLKFGLKEAEKAAAQASTTVVWNACTVNCGSRCPLRLVVSDGQIIRVEPDDTGEDVYGNHQVRCCVRGHSIRKRVYNPDRLKYPMKRTGKRGLAQFERISWDEAFSTIASELKRIKEKYGNESIYIHYATGSLGATIAKSWPPGSSPIARLMNLYGGYLNQYGTYSAAQIEVALPYTFGGSWVSGNSISDTVNSKLVVFFGDNPAATRMSGGGIIHDLQNAEKLSDVKLIVIDPRYTDTNVVMPVEWIPIRPGTDAALVNALAYVMISENLVDQEFLDKYCIGYDEQHMPEGIPSNNSYKSYISGKGADKTPKTPQWAASITGIPGERIVRLAREIALSKPAYIAQGWGPQRQANGEETCRAISMLPILTGNVGIHGGNTGAREGGYSIPFASFPVLENPVKTSIPVFLWTDAIYRGTEMTAKKDGIRGKDKLDVPIKFIWNYAGNTLINQHGDVNRTVKLLEDDTLCEMIVVIDTHMAPSARFADILLPDTSSLEKNDFSPQGSAGTMGYVICDSQAIEPLFESRSIYDICVGIAKKLGLEEKFTEGRTNEEWLQYIYEQSRKMLPELPDYQSFQKMGIYKQKNPDEPPVAFESFRKDPKANPLDTPSGKIEIFSKRLWDIGKTWELPEGDVITALPEYTPTWEGVSDPLKEKYPLQMIGHHYKQRTHSTYGDVEWLKKTAPQEVWINSNDAKERGIKHLDLVRVFNDRGETILPAKVTLRITPGVISIPEGAWFTPEENNVDHGGCTNVLTSWRPSPLAKGPALHTCLAQVEKA
jgi:anaerobic dimethyl sulfoxide reductase subunit A